MYRARDSGETEAIVKSLAADQPQAPPELRTALRAIGQHIEAYITRTRLTRAA